MESGRRKRASARETLAQGGMLPRPMLVTFVAPFYSENAKLFLRYVSGQADVELAVISQEDVALLPAETRARVVHAERVADAIATDQIVAATRRIEAARGRVARLLGVVEQVQVALGEAREALGLPGMRSTTAHNFRDKTRMKDLLREAGVPVARHRLVETTDAALSFAREVGYPLVVKPPAGAAAQTTYRVGDDRALREALGPASRAAGGAVLLEEFVTGEEHSFDAFVRGGEVVFYSVSNYHPTPLEVMQNPWMQWVVVMPREHEAADIADVGARALRVLGLEEGMCHLEWFRRKDGSLVVSEVGARPPGAQFTTLISRAHDRDCVEAWARLAVHGTFEPFPTRAFAAGAAYLRGQGEGRVRRVTGLEVVDRELGSIITDRRIPEAGTEKAKSYEGEGFILVRHPETSVVKAALERIVSTVRVELGS